MFVSKLKLVNWRNFKEIDVRMEAERMFIVGANASGKSNLLDVFRLLNDIARPDGGMQKAVMSRGGMAGIRNFSAHQTAAVEIDIQLDDRKNNTTWNYQLHLDNRKADPKTAVIKKERILKNQTVLLDRPDDNDKEDAVRLTQTSMEQVMANKAFRDIANHFASIRYLHLVPQLLRFPHAFTGPNLEHDPFGKHFMERVAAVDKKTLAARLKKIEAVLRVAVPGLTELTFVKDERGLPHFEMSYEQWRGNGGRKGQTEDGFSDGTLRLIGLLWGVMEPGAMLLLEEPELSLHDELVNKLPGLIHRLKKRNCQILVSTHSQTMLSDKGIGGEEVLVLTPGEKGTAVNLASSFEDTRTLLENGMSAGEAVIPHTTPGDMYKLGLLK